MDHLSFVFSIDAPRRVWVCTRTGTLFERPRANARTFRLNDCCVTFSSDAFCRKPRCRCLRSSDVVVAWTAHPISGNTFRCSIDDRTSFAKLVRENEDGVRPRSVLPLCRQQC